MININDNESIKIPERPESMCLSLDGKVTYNSYSTSPFSLKKRGYG